MTIYDKKEVNYKEVNGTAYHAETPAEVINVLERCKEGHVRIIVDYGDVKSGKSWDESYGTSGYIGRSMGNVRIPLMIHNSRSLGGPALLDDCIIGIKTSKGKRTLYSLKVT